jgi:hypothetical protein
VRAPLAVPQAKLAISDRFARESFLFGNSVPDRLHRIHVVHGTVGVILGGALVGRAGASVPRLAARSVHGHLFRSFHDSEIHKGVIPFC